MMNKSKPIKSDNFYDNDFFHFAMQLWLNKKSLLLMMELFIFIGGSYLTMLKPIWAFESVIALPELNALSHYNENVNDQLLEPVTLYLSRNDDYAALEKFDSKISAMESKEASYSILSCSTSNVKLAQSLTRIMGKLTNTK